MGSTHTFIKDDGTKLPVSDDFLVPFLSPTSPGTNYWDSPPPTDAPNGSAALTRARGRVIHQLHQALDVLSRTGLDLRGKRLLDVGTGNGMIPKLMLHYSEIESAVGIDPYLDGEHKTSWQPHDQDAYFLELTEFIDGHCKEALIFEDYQAIAQHQDVALRPAPFPIREKRSKNFRFEQIGAHDLGQLDEKFDILYAKAIDHIPNWEGIFASMADVAAPDAIVCIKHFSFFSYLGPHRYATTNIPWGHLLLTDDEYRRFAAEHHGTRTKEMIDFYFNGLSYPRTTISQMVEMAGRNGFVLQALTNEPMRNAAKILPLQDQVPNFWEIIRRNHPTVSADEMFSGRYHVLFRRVA